MVNNYILTYYNRFYNPSNWYYNPNYLTNRIYYIVGGTAFYQDTVPLKPGHLYVFRASSDFKVAQDESDPIDHIFFDFISSEQLINEDYLEINVEENPHLKLIAELLTDSFERGALKSPQSVSRDVAEAYFTLLVSELKSHLVNVRLYGELTSEIFRLIHEMSPCDLSVEAIACELNMNVNHIIRTFKNETGITPHKYINLMKSNLAIENIQKGQTLQETAEFLGFSSVSALSVFFKRTTGRNLSYFRQF